MQLSKGTADLSDMENIKWEVQEDLCIKNGPVK
jgi:hypothetical protein